MNEDPAGIGGHANPVRDSRLKSPAFAAMTDVAARSFERTGEVGPGLRLRRLARIRPAGYDTMGRNIVWRATICPTK